MGTHGNYIALDSVHGIWQQRLPRHLYCFQGIFNRLWQLHPRDFPCIFLHGREVKLPRWQQAYGKDYRFSGKSSRAKCIPELLQPYLDWARDNIDSNFDGMLLNWYDASSGHYIGAHRDSEVGLIKNSKIMMISLGESRVTRFRPVSGKGYQDVEVKNGEVLIMSLATNRHFKHEVPKFKRYQGKRISITLRCFTKDV